MSRLDYPFTPLPRLAVFSLAIPQSRQVRVFRAGEWKALERFRPEALAGWYSDLVLVGQLRNSGVLALPDLNAPLLVFSHPETGPLTEDHHTHLWRLFGIPFFEQVRDSAGDLLAQECEARDGFHLLPGAAHRVCAEAYAEPCPCGRPDPRYRITGARRPVFAAERAYPQARPTLAFFQGA